MRRLGHTRLILSACALCSVFAGSSALLSTSQSSRGGIISTLRVRADSLRFSTSAFTPGGFAYDVASRRFVIGDLNGRRVMVVGVDTKRAVDMVRAESARFGEVVDLAIDQTRGDLWLSSRGLGGASSLHRLQLISGRPLRIYHPPTSAGQVRLGDLAVARSGQIVALDLDGGRLLTPAANGLDLRVLARVTVTPSSLAMAPDGKVAFVAHSQGIARVDLASGSVTEVAAAADAAIAGFERVRVFRDGLIGLQRSLDGSRRLVFVPLRARGGMAGLVSVLDVTLPAQPRPPFLAVHDDEVLCLIPAGEGSPSDTESVIHRIRPD